MNEKELYTELSRLTKNKAQWKNSISFIASLLTGHSTKIVGKSLWMLGEIGKMYPDEIRPFIENIAAFLDSEDAFLRERTLNALGRIGRADVSLIRPNLDGMLSLSDDDAPNVRLAFIWASENIAANAPEVYERSISVFEKLLDDENVRVRMEAPEIFRVLGKRKPEYVSHCLDKLRNMSLQDTDRVVRIHAEGAVKVISPASIHSQYEL